MIVWDGKYPARPLCVEDLGVDVMQRCGEALACNRKFEKTLVWRTAHHISFMSPLFVLAVFAVDTGTGRDVVDELELCMTAPPQPARLITIAMPTANFNQVNDALIDAIPFDSGSQHMLRNRFVRRARVHVFFDCPVPSSYTPKQHTIIHKIPVESILF